MEAGIQSPGGAVAVGPRRRPVLRTLRREWPVTLAAAFLLVVVLVAIFAPLIAPFPPDHVDLSNVYASPSAEHLLGTDASGRDIFSRLIYGARTSLLGPLGVIALATLIGVCAALVAAWWGGWVDSTISAVIDVLFAFPGLLLAIGASAVFGVGLLAPVVALGIAYTPYVARVVRSLAIRERTLPYVAATTVLGLPRRRILLRHLLPGLTPLILTQATLAFGYATIDLAAISFLGLGVQPPSSDWGLMVAQGRPGILAGHPAEALYPAIALLLVVLSVMVIGRRFARQTGSSL
ncbi:MAG: ABC transporter permease [Actinobacteria bacterium]|nr:ABC transporter permease [Actinomycetota bacterium]